MPPRRATSGGGGAGSSSGPPRPIADAYGVKWFGTQAAAQAYVQHQRMNRERAFGVHIRDRPDRFAFYASFAHFWSVYSELTREQRHAWCEHLTGGARKLYFDIEWVGPDDKQPTNPLIDVVDAGVREVLAKCSGSYDDRLSYHILTCHRPVASGYKYSLHLRYTQLAFRNHADMSRFIQCVMLVLERHEVLRRVEHDTGAVVFIVDKSVYKFNQSLRCPLATKWSTDIRFPVGALGYDRIEDAHGLASPADLFVQAVDDAVVTYIDVDQLPPLPSSSRPNAAAVNKRRQVTLDSMFGAAASRPAARQRVHDLPPAVEVSQYETNSVRELLVTNGVPVPRGNNASLDWQRTAIIADEFLAPVDLPAGQTCVVCKRVHDRDHVLWVVYARRTASVVITCPQTPDKRAVFYLVPAIGTWFDDEAVPWNEVHGPEVDTILPYEFPPPKNTLLVEAQYGMGKTRAIGDLMASMPRSACILFVTNRIKLAQKYAADFALHGVLNYEDHPTPDKPSPGFGFRVATCYNSLQRYSMPYGTRYDLIVLDEISSVLPDTNSRFVANRDSLLFTFGNLVRNADRVIGLDADVSYLAYVFMLQLRGAVNLHTVCYDYRRPTDRVIYECSSQFDSLIMADIAAGRRVVVASMTKSYADELYAKIEIRFGGDVNIAYGKITSAYPNGVSVRGGGFKANDPTTWNRLNCLVYSPSIGAGVSCELDHFDRLYLYAWVSPGTPTCYDVLQMMHRVRSLREGSIFVFFAHLPDDSDSFDLTRYPESAAEVLKMFERRDTKVFEGLLGRPEPITRQRINTDLIITPEYTMEFWPTALYVYSLLRVVRSITHFKPLFYAALLDQRYRREVFQVDVTPPEQTERNGETAMATRIAHVDALAAKHPDLPRCVIDHFYQYPDALRHCVDVWEWRETPQVVYERLATRTNIDTAATSPSLARRDSVLDQRSTQWLYFLRFADQVLQLRGREMAVGKDEWAELVANTMRYLTEHPRASVRRLVTNGQPPDPTSRAAEMYLKMTAREFGVDVLARPPNRAGNGIIYQASLTSFDQLQVYARSSPSDFHQFIYDMCKDAIEARRSNEQATLTESALGEWWLFK